MDLQYKEQESFLLNRVNGIKCVLFDTENTKQILNNSVSYSQLLLKDYFYFDYLTNKRRSKLNITAVVILDSTNLKMLIDELIDPYYNSYIVCFKNTVDPFALEILAGADRNGVVLEVHEINMEAIKIDEYFYKLRLENLISFFHSLNLNPNFCTMKNISEEILKKVNLQEFNYEKSGHLLILERNFDLITPLMTDWTYQSSIHQHLFYENGTVKINNRNFSIKDEFFNENKFLDLQKVGENLKLLIKELERKKHNISNNQYDDIEEATNYSKVIETHLSIHNKVLDECMRLEDVGLSEIRLLKNENHFEMPAGLSKKQLIKLQILNSLKQNSKDFNLNEELHHKFIELFNPINFAYKYTFNDQTTLLSYESPIKKIVKHFIKNKLNQTAFTKINKEGEDSNIFFIYIHGGVTYREYKDIMKQAKNLNAQVYLLSNKIVNQNYFLQKLGL
ncbi:hypothetical protein NUSPORA_01178 [Nucleospora cyclopteri]